METKAIIEEARERFKRVRTAEEENRKEAKIDLRFAAGLQWEETEKRNREGSGRPVVICDQIHGAISQIVSRQRQTKPGIKISPVSQATKAEADIRQGLIRHIEYNSGGEVADDTAFQNTVICGAGYAKVTTQYVDDDSDEQELIIKRIPDSMSVYIDSDSMEVDGSDAQYVFIVSQGISKSEFERRYPDAPVSSSSFYADNMEWGNEDSIVTAEYWTIEIKKAKGGKYGKRDVEKKIVTQYVINGDEILETHEWLGSSIPIIPLYGEEIYVDGKRKLISVIRRARDPQRMYNYYASLEAEALAGAPRPKWVGVTGQFETNGQKFANANRLTDAYLEYDSVLGANGQPVGPPVYQTFDPKIESYAIAKQQAKADIQSGTITFDPGLGAPNTKDRSGKAVLALQQQGESAHFPLLDSFSRYKRRMGQILIEMIPLIYDEPREIRILGSDLEQEILKVNEPYLDPKTNQLKHHDLKSGKYDVTVDIGPTYQNQMQDAFAHLNEILTARPETFPMYADLYFEMAGWGPIGDQMADRARAMLPPQLQPLAEGQQQIPPQVQAQLQQAMGQNHQLTQALNDANYKLAAKLPEIQSREKMEQLKIAASIRIAEITASKDLDKANADRLANVLEGMHDNAHEAGMQAVDHQHEAEMQQQQQDAAMQQQQAAQQADAQQPGNPAQ